MARCACVGGRAGRRPRSSVDGRVRSVCAILYVLAKTKTAHSPIERRYAMLGDRSDQWLTALDSFPRFSPERRVQFLDLLGDHCARVSGEDRIALRRALRRMRTRP